MRRATALLHGRGGVRAALGKVRATVMAKVSTRRRGFSLVELVVVVMIIGMLASMAIPRLSRGAVGASEAALAGNLKTIRSALLYYAIEHRNAFPGGDADTVVLQLTAYSDTGGGTSETRTGAFIYGPYLSSIPPCTIGPKADSNGILIDSVNSPPTFQAGSSAGWLYNPNTGEFYPNVPASALQFLPAALKGG